MYLAVLPQKAKENFLNLALYVANADNQFSARFYCFIIILRLFRPAAC